MGSAGAQVQSAAAGQPVQEQLTGPAAGQLALGQSPPWGVRPSTIYDQRGEVGYFVER